MKGACILSVNNLLRRNHTPEMALVRGKGIPCPYICIGGKAKIRNPENTMLIFVHDQFDAQFFFMYVYFYSLHVSGSHVPIIRRINCINTTSGICHSV